MNYRLTRNKYSPKTCQKHQHYEKHNFPIKKFNQPPSWIYRIDELPISIYIKKFETPQNLKRFKKRWEKRINSEVYKKLFKENCKTCSHVKKYYYYHQYWRAFQKFYQKKADEYFSKRSRDKRKCLHEKLDKSWTKEMKKCFKENMLKCAWCGRKSDLCVDHMKPLEKGFGLNPYNVTALCKKCNSWKSSFSFQDFKWMFPKTYKKKIKLLLESNKQFRKAWKK